MTRKKLLRIAALSAALLCAALPLGHTASAAGGAPYPGTSLAPRASLPFSAHIYDVLCTSHILTAVVTAVDANAAAPGQAFAISRVSVDVLNTLHRSRVDCAPSEDPANPPIDGLPAHVVGPARATLHVLGGYRGSGPYRTLAVPREYPYFFPGQTLLLVLPDVTRRPLVLEVTPDGRLFHPGDGRRVTDLNDEGFALSAPTSLEPAAAHFVSGKTAGERAYPDEGTIETGVNLEDVLLYFQAWLDNGFEPLPDEGGGAPGTPGPGVGPGLWGYQLRSLPGGRGSGPYAARRAD